MLPDLQRFLLAVDQKRRCRCLAVGGKERDACDGRLACRQNSRRAAVDDHDRLVGVKADDGYFGGSDSDRK
jgi:hypothetical protein